MPLPRVAVFSCLAVATAASCSPPRLSEAAALLDTQPLALDFGPVPVGLPSSLTVRLRNTGVATLNVQGVVTDAAGFATSGAPTQVAAGERVDLEVRFTPPQEGDFIGALTITSDARDNPTQRVTLHGTGVARVVCVDCSTPPPPFCTAAGALVSYLPTGTCVGGRCQYEARTMPCPSGCDAASAQCRGAPDAGSADGGGVDAGAGDAGAADAGAADAGAGDAGAADAGPADAGTGSGDGGRPDAGCPAGLDVRPDLNQNLVPDCAETLVANSQAAGAVSPWAAVVTPPNTAALSLSSADELGFPGSGSLLVTNTSNVTTANGAAARGECIAVAPAALYGTYVRYFMASGQPGGDALARAWVTFDAYSDSACGVPAAGISGGPLGSTKDGWATYSRQLDTGDGGAFGPYRSVRISLGVLKGATTSPVQATFDNVLFVRE